jgi:DNA-3-methyladenine glycosylase
VGYGSKISVETAAQLAYKVRRLARPSLPTDTTALARYLIGKTIVREDGRGRISGRIVETEAYPPGDSTSYAYRGRTVRNQAMFLGKGFAHVYFVYGVSYMLNVSSERPGVGAGILLRALEPLEGIDRMKELRKTEKLTDLARGPGRLAVALEVDMSLDGVDLCAEGPIWLGSAVRKTAPISTSVRIGLSRELDRPLRFFEAGSPFVSGPRGEMKSR